jgi:hypothetical protein
MNLARSSSGSAAADEILSREPLSPSDTAYEQTTITKVADDPEPSISSTIFQIATKARERHARCLRELIKRLEATHERGRIHCGVRWPRESAVMYGFLKT